MKRNSLILTAAVLSMLSLTACGGKQTAVPEGQPETEAVQAAEAPEGEETASEAAQDMEKEQAAADGTVEISFEENTQEYKAQDGTVLLTVKTVLPRIAVSGNETAGKAVGEELADYVQSPDISIEQIMEWAQQDYEQRGKDNWYGYALETVFSESRADKAVISFVADDYIDMGGAHPSAARSGLNFNPKTGERYMLADVVKEEDTAKESILAFLLEEAKRDSYSDMFFEGYEENIGDLLTEDTWYLGEDGFHVIGNEYIISPHVAGILDFVIPYEEADFLKEEFRM